MSNTRNKVFISVGQGINLRLYAEMSLANISLDRRSTL